VGTHDDLAVEASGRVTEETVFQRKVRERRERLAAEAQASTPARGMAAAPAEYSDLVPDADDGDAYARSDTDLTIDRLIENLDIRDAYDRWIPKPRPNQPGNKREGIMVRCPRPDHTDNNPSAWLNADKGTWYCGGCGEGGDKLDLASYYFGIGDYRHGKAFGELRKRVAESLGYKVIEAPGVTNPPVVAVAAPEPAPEPESAPPLPPTPVASASDAAPAPVAEVEEPIATVTSIFGDDVEKDEIILPGIDWRPLVTPGTFLDTYMQQTIIDDVPEEYHFWNGLVAISMACGRDVMLMDRKPVLGNLFLCIVGKSGMGKSRALGHMTQLADMALPYDPSDPMDRGVKPINTPGSGEVLIHQFSKPIYDTSGAKPVIMGYAPVRGIVDFDELSALVARTSRQGSTLKANLMQFFDGRKTVTSASMASGDLRAELPYACVTAGVQPKALPGLLTDTDAVSGFLNRWLFVSGTPKKRMAIGGKVIDIRPCVGPLQKIHEWANGRGMLPWSDEAEDEFTRLFEERIDPLQQIDDTDLFTRIDLLCKKLCLLLSANEMLEEVSREIVLKVEQIFEYVCSVWNMQAENIGNTDEKQCEERIIDLLKRQGPKQKDGSLAIGYIVKIVGKKFPRRLVEECLRRLTSLHEIDSYVPPAPKIGRPPTPRYRLVSE
jgi:hypothetical protein